jgi:hypothetical protein
MFNYFKMEYFRFILLCLIFKATIAQKPQYIVHNLSLPKEISDSNNQFSGLYVYKEKLFLMSESRLQDSAEGKLYSINLSDLEIKIADTSYELPCQKYHLYNLKVLMGKINDQCQDYEGLEAIIIDNNDVYLSVETETASCKCYLVKGHLNDTAVIMNTDFLLPLSKPLAADGSHIYNAGFEAMAKSDDQIFAFFEYNYFPSNNYVYLLNNQFLLNKGRPDPIPINKLAFRVTDITFTGKNHFTAINFFFNGDDGETIYRAPAGDRKSNELIKDKVGYHNYCRLIDIELNGDKFTWKPLWEFPAQYMNSNWEGIASFKDDYFLINDKFAAEGPLSTLLYLQKVK